MEKFNYKFYTKYYLDIKHMNLSDAINHYKLFGIKEGRTHDMCSLTYKDFNYLYYINNLESLKDLNKNQAYYHYINYNRYVDDYTFEYLNFKTLVVYVYYNRTNEQRNELNLSFFINQTILKETSKDILYLFIINNKICEVSIPKR